VTGIFGLRQQGNRGEMQRFTAIYELHLLNIEIVWIKYRSMVEFLTSGHIAGTHVGN
jgi:hypothetical protein